MKRNVGYIGENKLFIEQFELNTDWPKKDEGYDIIDIESIGIHESSYIESVIKNKLEFVFIDLSTINYKITNFLMFLRENKLNLSVTTIGVFKDKNGYENFRGFHSIGIDLVYIFGESIYRMMSDALLIKSEQISAGPKDKFFTAKKLGLTSTAREIVKISEIESNRIIYESNIIHDINKNYPLHLNIYDKKYEIHVNKPKLSDGHTWFSFKNKKQMTVLENDLMQFNQWKKKAIKQEDYQIKTKALIIDSELKSRKSYINNQYPGHTNIKFMEFLDKNLNIIKEFQPELIAIEISDNEAASENLKNSAETFELIIDKIFELSATESYTPFIVIFKSFSKTNALRKAFNYNKIVASDTSMSLETLNIMLGQLVASSKTETEHMSFLDGADKHSDASIDFNIKLEELNEHEIIFQSDLDIPINSNIELDLGAHVGALIVPNDKEFTGEISKGFKIYRAILIGLDESDKRYLRQLVHMLALLDVDEKSQLIIDSIEKMREQVSHFKRNKMGMTEEAQMKQLEEGKMSKLRKMFLNDLF